MAQPSSQLTLFVLEIAVTVLVLVVMLALPQPRGKRRLKSRFAAFSQRRGLAVLGIALLAWIGRLVLLGVLPIPHPFVHDEFSYLLAADTYASGRLTNPTHPLWPYFESFHITMKPSYMSMYFPAQGMVLALGQAVFGHPFWGVWLSVGILCGAICWMLQGWLPPRWAMLGGLLAVVRLGWFSYWADSYWGGAVPAIGGALVLGALPRMLRRPRVRETMLFCAGLAILANSRPYEGLLIAVPACIRLLWGRPQWRVLALSTGLMATVAAGMLFYNTRVFGDPLVFPYQANYRQYIATAQFLWQKFPPVPQYRHAVMKDFYVSRQRAEAEDARTPAGFLRRVALIFTGTTVFFFGMVLLIPLAWLPRALRDRRVRYLAIAGAIFAVGMILNPWFLPHYAAPATALLYALLVQSMRHMAIVRPAGVRLIAAACLLLALLRAAGGPLGIAVSRTPAMWYGTPPEGLPRAAVAAQLERAPGNHLAIVRYTSQHDSLDEWVYNRADIDHARIVWARDMPGGNGDLVRYFQDRTVWLIEPDRQPPGVTRFR